MKKQKAKNQKIKKTDTIKSGIKKIMKKKWLVVSVVIVVIIVAFSVLGQGDKETYDFATVHMQSEMIHEVSATGRVKSSQSVDLSFERSGKVDKVEISVGDRVEAGQTLVVLNSTDLYAQLSQASAGVESAKAQLVQYQASLDIQKARLNELKSGAREEEIQISKTKVSNAEKAIEDAYENLENVKNKANADLRETYETTLSTMAQSVNIGLNSIFTITDIQYAHFINYDQNSYMVASTKEDAIYALLGEPNAGRWANSSISTLNGGAKLAISNAQLDINDMTVSSAVSQTKDAIQKIQAALNSIPLLSSLSSTEIANLSSTKSNTNNELITVIGRQQGIEIQKTVNQSAISSAASAVTNAENALVLAQNELSLILAGSTEQQIQSQEAQVRQSEAVVASGQAQIKQAYSNVANIRAQIEKTILKSPISGIVSKQNAKIGEIISLGSGNTSPVVSIISEFDFEIEVNIPEADITKTQIGNPCQIVLDALPKKTFEGRVVMIDPAQQIIGGVIYYKVKVVFDETDEEIKVGMTTDITIITDTVENVLAIPRRAVVERGGKKLVRILDGNEIREVEIETGLEGIEGNTEITSGLREGEKIITFIKK